MKVQHPSQRAHVVAPAGQQPIQTDDEGVAEVSDDLAEKLIEQGWVKVQSSKKKES